MQPTMANSAPPANRADPEQVSRISFMGISWNIWKSLEIIVVKKNVNVECMKLPLDPR